MLLCLPISPYDANIIDGRRLTALCSVIPLVTMSALSCLGVCLATLTNLFRKVPRSKKNVFICTISVKVYERITLGIDFVGTRISQFVLLVNAEGNKFYFQDSFWYVEEIENRELYRMVLLF